MSIRARWLWIAMGLFVLGCGAGRVTFDSDGGLGGSDGALFSDGTSGGGGDAGSTWDGGQGADGGDVCLGVDCSGHGTCQETAGQAQCVCNDGYHAEGLACIEDDPCQGVQCGANAHCVSGACRCDDGYEGDPVAGCHEPNPTEAQIRQQLVDIALAEVGKCEHDDGTDPVYMTGQPGYWCYDFVAWVYQECDHPLPSPISLPHHAASEVPDQFMPEPGDLIKFQIQHFGMVRSVSADGQTIQTVEGNVSRCVTTRTVSLSSIEYFGSLETVLNN